MTVLILALYAFAAYSAIVAIIYARATHLYTQAAHKYLEGNMAGGRELHDRAVRAKAIADRLWPLAR